MTPEVFALWAAGAPLNEVLQVCHEDQFTDDPVVRALVTLLERSQQDAVDVVGDLNGRLNEAFFVGVSVLATEVEDFLEDIGDEVPVVDVRGAIEGLADSLSAGEYPSEDLTINAISSSFPGRVERMGVAKRRMAENMHVLPRGIYQPEVLKVLRLNNEPMTLVEVVREVVRRLGRTKTNAIYTAISALKMKGQIEELDNNELRIKGGR